MPDQNQKLEEDVPIEIFGAIPASVTSFAAALVQRRALAESLEVAFVGSENAATELRRASAVEELADLPGYGDWLDWVAHWACRFSELSDASAVSLRMSHSRHATCPRFHMDAVRMRLIATLLGPGTEWLRPVDVTCATDGSIGQTPKPDRVQQMSPGSVGIFKGATFNPMSRRGVVHRSPQDRVDRVVMTLDIAA